MNDPDDSVRPLHDSRGTVCPVASHWRSADLPSRVLAVPRYGKAGWLARGIRCRALRFCVVMLGMALAPLAAGQDPSREELKLQLPKPMFIGTPTNLKSANLEAITGKPRGPFYVPVGTKLVSLNRPVKSSDMQPVIGELSMVTDGEKEGGDGYFIELGPGKQWAQIDLGASSVLHAILAWHYHSQARVYRDVVVQVSADKDFLRGVTTIFNNDHDNTSGLGIGRDKEYIEVAEGRLFDPKGVKGRYVRLYSNGNTANDLTHYVEVEVYGTPAK